jgi:hypothetical protein
VSSPSTHAFAAGWRIIPSPLNSAFYSQLSSVAAISSTDAWAVGNIGFQPLIEHWDGAHWRAVSAPFIEAESAELYSIAAVSAHDVWAVGVASASGGLDPLLGDSLSQTLIEHWNGSHWSVVPSPDPVTGTNILSGVVKISANDLWAVGTSRVNRSAAQTLVEHWDGTSWKVVPSPNQTNAFSTLNSVTKVSANDIWAVGSATAAQSGGPGTVEPWGATMTLIEHWDGTSWSIVPSANEQAASPGDFVENTLSAVSAVSTADVWAVGNASLTFPSTGKTSIELLIEHWNGIRWSAVSVPSIPSIQSGVGPDSGLYGVQAISASDIWAVGSVATAHYTNRNLLMHWNGINWSIISGPNGYYGKNSLSAVAATSESDVWAVGSDEPLNLANQVNQGLVIHGP